MMKTLAEILGSIFGEILGAAITAAIVGFAFHMCYDWGIAWEFNLPQLGFKCFFWFAFALVFFIYNVCVWMNNLRNHNK